MPEKRKNPHAVALGRRGGLKGGWLRWWASLTPEQRTEHQRRAAAKRWAGHVKTPPPATPPAGPSPTE